MIIAIGYRVRSHRGIKFRRWATEILNECLVKGFTMNDERLKGMKNFGQEFSMKLVEIVESIKKI